MRSHAQVSESKSELKRVIINVNARQEDIGDVVVDEEDDEDEDEDVELGGTPPPVTGLPPLRLHPRYR